jgi:hypothetical protein
MSEYYRSERAGDAGATFRRWTENDYNEISRARQAAEALFAQKHHVTEPSTPANVLSTDQTARKPRILSAVRVPPTRVESRRRDPIPASHLASIRTWLKYGMTVLQVAEIYGVTIGDIESILQKA